jgi:uncharacterized membrane protein
LGTGAIARCWKAPVERLTSLRSISSQREKWLRRLFRIGVLFKGLDGLLETIGGAVFLTVSRQMLNRLVIHLTRPELLEDPDDLIANALRHAFGHLSASGKFFGGVYLLVHGAIKIFLVVCLLRGKLWSFPTAIMALVVFIGYQVYHLSVHFSWILFFLTMLDIIIIMLIWHEYGYVKQRRKERE